MTKIMLDPGHGGGRAYNRGFVPVVGWSYCNEGDNNFIYSRDFLKPALERVGFYVEMTKSTIGPDPSLKARGAKAKGFDLLISVHSNAANGRATGVEIYDSTNPKESCKSLCDQLCSAIAMAIGTNNRGTKYRRNRNGSNYYGILRYGLAKKNIIIEHAFHDNHEDARKFVTNLRACAEATAKVLANYYGLKTSDTAPAKPQDKDFVEIVQEHLNGTKLRLLPSVTIAQAILESDWGRSDLAKNANNLFGIKDSLDWHGETYTKATWEQKTSGEKYQINAAFRKYLSIKDSIIDHDNFFVSTDWRRLNYAQVLNAKNYKDQCRALQECGYATDLNYAKKLVSLIERLGLQRYDKGVIMDINKISDWAKDAWEWGKEKGITDGARPGAEMTREEMVTILYRYDQKRGDKNATCNCSDVGSRRFDTGL